MKQGQCICPLSSSVHCNFTGDDKCNKTGWACTPHPHQARLILPSWLNVRQKADVTSLCTLWSGCFNLCLISGLLFLPAPIHTKQKCWESESNQDLFNNIFYSVWILIAYWVNLQFRILCYDRFVILHWNCVIPIITRWAWATYPPQPPPPSTRIQPALRLYSKKNTVYGTVCWMEPYLVVQLSTPTTTNECFPNYSNIRVEQPIEKERV